MATNDNNRAIKLAELDKQLLFLLDDQYSLSNAKIARILAKHKQVTNRNLQLLKNVGLVEQNKDQEYLITDKGSELTKELICQQSINQAYNEELRDL